METTYYQAQKGYEFYTVVINCNNGNTRTKKAITYASADRIMNGKHKTNSGIKKIKLLGWDNADYDVLAIRQ